MARWRCCAEGLSYQVLTPSKIKIFRHQGEPQGEDFPYEAFPQEFERRRLRLVPLPYDLSKLLALVQEIDTYWLSDADSKSLYAGLTATFACGGRKWRWKETVLVFPRPTHVGLV